MKQEDKKSQASKAGNDKVKKDSLVVRSFWLSHFCGCVAIVCFYGVTMFGPDLGL